jgi:hypothetical protein
MVWSKQQEQFPWDIVPVVIKGAFESGGLVKMP